MPEAFFRPRPFGSPNLAPFEHSAIGRQTPGSEFMTFMSHLVTCRAKSTGSLGAFGTPAERSRGYLHSVRYDAMKKRDQATFAIAERLYWAHSAYSFPYIDSIFLRRTLQLYD